MMMVCIVDTFSSQCNALFTLALESLLKWSHVLTHCSHYILRGMLFRSTTKGVLQGTLLRPPGEQSG